MVMKMKNLMKKLTSLLLAAMLLLTVTSAMAEEKTYTIGILQFAEHGSLDNCRTGFEEGLAAEGFVEGQNVTYIYQNAQADMATTNQIAAALAEKCDQVCAIATPAAMAALNACEEKGVPVIYTAVSDPVSAKLAKEDGTSDFPVTGTSDALPVEAQLKLIRALLPDAKKIGILYTTSEANSISTIATYKELAPKYDFEIVDTGINTIADVDLAAADLVSKVDCICNLTDNTVVEALQTVIDKANAQKIPVFGSEIEQVKNGCVASMGIDYFALGKETGLMAAKILKGEATAQDTPYISASAAELYVNTAAAEKIGMTLDDSYVSTAAEKFDTIEA